MSSIKQRLEIAGQAQVGLSVVTFCRVLSGNPLTGSIPPSFAGLISLKGV